MRVLLDSHAVIWWVDQDSLLSIASHAAIADPGLNQERLARLIPGLAEAMAWPEAGESDRAC